MSKVNPHIFPSGWWRVFTILCLRCDTVALEDALCKRVMITPEEVIKRSLDPLSAAVSRDGLAKTIYSRLFDWYSACQFFNSCLIDHIDI